MVRREDDRGVSAVIGGVLLLLILVLLFSTLQATGVPNWNQRVEFDHNQRVQDDLDGLRNAIIDTAADGHRRSAAVELGTSYPSRVVLQNPSAPNGRLYTNDSGTIVIENATAPGEAGDYWDGTQNTFLTRPVVYTPNYNYYTDSPDTVLETGVVFNRFDDASIALAEQTLVDGNRITLYTVNGSLSRHGTDTASIDTVPASAPMRALTVENESGMVTIEVPTRVPNSTWADVLAAQYTGKGGHIVNQSYVEGIPYNTLVLKLESGVTYDLKLARVGVGEDVADPGPHYIVRGTETKTVSAGDDGLARVVVEVRDRFNNPVTNANVTFNATFGHFENGAGANLSKPATVRTDAEGRAVIWHNSTDGLGVHDVTAYLGTDVDDTLPPRERVDFDVVNTGSGGAAGAGAESIVVWQDATPTDEGEAGGDPPDKNQYLSLNYTLNNKGSSALNVTGFQVRFITVSDSGTMRDGPESVEWIAMNVSDGNRTIDKREGTGATFWANDPFTMPPGKNALKIRFDTWYDLGNNNDAIFVSVSMYFEAGLTSEYTVWFFENELE